jgi:ABC-type glycerol-3-phosphate transport system substrate-binding protein
MTRIRGVLALAACLAAAACGGTPGEPDESPGVIGTIQQIQNDVSPPRFLVEQVANRNAGEPVAWVEIVEHTRIYERVDGRLASLPADVLQVGDQVSVWFAGPVRESWPVQAVGGTIIREN